MERAGDRVPLNGPFPSTGLLSDRVTDGNGSPGIGCCYVRRDAQPSRQEPAVPPAYRFDPATVVNPDGNPPRPR
jgi:hypothetical protein